MNLTYTWTEIRTAPRWWSDFVHSIFIKDGAFKPVSVATELEFLEECEAWGVTFEEGRFCTVTGACLRPAHIHFKSEKHLTAFLLRWS